MRGDSNANGFTHRVPRPQSRRATTIVAVIVMCLLLFGCVSFCSSLPPLPADPPKSTAQVDDTPSDAMMIVAAKDAVTGMLKDPDSARFSNVGVRRGHGKIATVCGYVNAKNGFGGYDGAEPFFSGGLTGNTMLSSQMRSREFRKAWKALCVDRPPN